MDIIRIDLHKRESQVCVLDARGGVTETRIVTTRERFATALAPYGPARILLEASTESEWVSTRLESLGHAVIVADPNFAPMYATRKTSRLGVQLRAQRETAKRLTAAGVRGNALLGGALRVEDIVGARAREGLTELKPTAGRERA